MSGNKFFAQKKQNGCNGVNFWIMFEQNIFNGYCKLSESVRFFLTLKISKRS